MLVKTIGKDRMNINPSHWKIETFTQNPLERKVRVRLSGFVGDDAVDPVDGRWFSVASEDYDKMGTVDEAYTYITAQATDDRGVLLWIDAQGDLTTVDTGTPAGNADESGTRGEFLGVVPQ